MDNLMTVSNLKKSFKENIVLKGISFGIRRGEVLCILGPNGAGKSTTINILTAVLGSDEGDIFFKGTKISKILRNYKQSIGIVPQDIALYEELSAERNLRFFASLYGLYGSRLNEAVEEALTFAGLKDRRKDKVKTFSGGMKRRLNIACAIAHHPELVIMDEPTVGIDPQSRNHILSSIKKLQNQGMTVIYTTHYMEEVEVISSRIIIMDHGAVIAEGTKESLKEDIQNEKRYIIEVEENGTMGLLFQDTDLAAQCFIYNLGNLNMERCHVIYEKFKELYEDSDLFSIVDFAQIYFTNENGILPQYPALTDKQIDKIPYGPVVKAVLLIENAGALLEKMQYEEAENCIIKGIKIAAGLNPFIGFFAYNQLGQVYEEMGRLNDSFSCYAKSKEVLKPINGLMGIETNYYFGLAGVYMRRMELEQAEIELEYSKRLLEERHIHVDITDMTLDYHLAEMKFLHGDNDTAVSYVEGILTEYPNYSVLTLGRLLYELACIDRLPESLSDNILKEQDATNKYSQQPLMKLLRGRILFKLGSTAEALKETEEILTSSRLNHNMLRLVEADILKIYMLFHLPDKSASQREIRNLLVEAIHYAQENRILMPFYLDRNTLLPMLREIYQKSAGNQLLSAAETAFLGETIVICGGQTYKENKPELLSARENEVLSQLAQGITNREIAEKLCISQATVKTHVLSIFGKLGVSSRMLAVEKARKEGLI